MKKTYINPELEVVKMVINHQLLDGSITVDTGTTPTDPSGSDSRFFEDFDDVTDFDNF